HNDQKLRQDNCQDAEQSTGQGTRQNRREQGSRGKNGCPCGCAQDDAQSDCGKAGGTQGSPQGGGLGQAGGQACLREGCPRKACRGEARAASAEVRRGQAGHQPAAGGGQEAADPASGIQDQRV